MSSNKRSRPDSVQRVESPLSCAETEVCVRCRGDLTSGTGRGAGVISSCCERLCTGCWVVTHLVQMPASLKCSCGKLPAEISVVDAAGQEHAVALGPQLQVFVSAGVRKFLRRGQEKGVGDI
jgi:hypothetical protein